MKEIPITKKNQSFIESEILHMLDHENILKTFGSFVPENQFTPTFCILTEACVRFFLEYSFLNYLYLIKSLKGFKFKKVH